MRSDLDFEKENGTSAEVSPLQKQTMEQEFQTQLFQVRLQLGIRKPFTGKMSRMSDQEMAQGRRRAHAGPPQRPSQGGEDTHPPEVRRRQRVCQDC